MNEIVCMVQKEVADRICSNPGNKTYGILSVLLQTYYNVKHLFNVKPKVFNPPPKVNSAVIRFERNNNKTLNCDEDLFFKTVKLAFNQRRKMLRNSLKTLLPVSKNDKLFSQRPEQLSYNDFIYLTKFM